MATEVWRWQGGTGGTDFVLGATVASDGSSILAGYTMENAIGTSTNSSEWIGVKLDADGTLQGQWQGGIAGFTPADAVAMGEDGSVVMVGTTVEIPPQSAAIKFDEDGNTMWEWEGGSEGGTKARTAALAGDGSIIVAGSQSTSVWSDLDGEGDFSVYKIDADGEYVWSWEDNTSGTDSLLTAVVADDGSVILAGYTYGNWSGVKSGEFASDFAAVKLDSDGEEIWRWQDGTSGYDFFQASAIGQDGSIVLAGETTGSWDGVHAGGTYDFAAVKLDANGDEIWRWQDGTAGEDAFLHAAAGDDGSFVLVGSTEGTWGVTGDGSLDFAAVKLDENGVECWRWQGASAEAVSDRALAIATGPNGQMLLAGYVGGTWAEASVGGHDIGALMLDTGTAVTPSPTLGVDEVTPPPTLTPAPPTTRTPTFPGGSTTPAPTAARPSGENELKSEPPSTRQPTTQQPILKLAPSVPGGNTPTPASPAPSSLEPTSSTQATRTPSPGLATLAPALSAQSSGTGFSSTKIGIVSAAATFAVFVVAGVFLRKKHKANKIASVRPARRSQNIKPGNTFGGNRDQTSCAISGNVIERPGPTPHPRNFPDTGVASTDSRTSVKSTSGSNIPSGGGQAPPAYGRNEPTVFVVPPTDTTEKPEPDTNTGTLSVVSSVSLAGRSDVAKAVLAAAYNLSQQSQIPGVCEAATLVSILVNLVIDDQDSTAEVDSRVKRCRLIIMILQRAAMVLGKGKDTQGEMERMLIEDVQAAVGDMVELIKTYRSKGRISQVIVSTMFKRRMEETDAVIDRAISDLKLGLHVRAAVNDDKDRQTVGGHFRNLQGFVPDKKDTIDAVRLQRQASQRKAVDRRQRRQRNLNQIEIPTEHVTISDELLGKGGFGCVYIADYNGRNAAAKVIKIDNEQSEMGGGDPNDTKRAATKDDASRKRASLLLELQAMLRLRSPHTVNVYGAITSRQDQLVLVMELLTGGSLRMLLKHTEERLPETQARQIIGVICAGMAFLHSKKAVHGDLKSANILLDGDGRAKIGDFGTSRWAQHSDSTGLATYKTKAGDTMMMMSFAWAAPEVLDGKGSTYASDVYSFAIVAWEVLSTQVPWADVALPRDIYGRVVFQQARPVMPADAPVDIADIVRECWAGTPRKRPSASQINGRLRYFRLQEE